MAHPSLGSPSGGAKRPADARALWRHTQRLARADAAPWLHAEVARRMAERLPLIKLQPDQVIDWWAPLSASRELLLKSCPHAQVLACLPQGLAARPRSWWQRLFPGRVKVVPESELLPQAAHMLWANMCLHGSATPPQLLGQWRQLLTDDGFVMFSTLGPGTLEELVPLFRSAGWGTPLAPLTDMHDLGDMLLQAGFADPVMDQETLTLHWASAEQLLAELRGLGGNAALDRHAGLRTPRWRQRLLHALHGLRDDQGRIALSFEVVYGHAFCAPPRVAVAPTTAIAVEQLRAMARSRPLRGATAAVKGSDRPR